MRKLILVSALLLAASSAQAGDSRGLSLAGIPTATAATEAPKPIAQVSVRLAQAASTASDAAPIQVQAQAAPAPVQAQAPAVATTAATTAATTTETKSAATTDSKPKTVKKVRRESDEAKARRIAAKYGVYW